MITINAHAWGVNLLNTILEMDDIPMEVIDRVNNALILIDPQPEDTEEMFEDALRYAGQCAEMSEKVIDEIIKEAKEGKA